MCAFVCSCLAATAAAAAAADPVVVVVVVRHFANCFDKWEESVSFCLFLSLSLSKRLSSTVS